MQQADTFTINAWVVQKWKYLPVDIHSKDYV